MKHSLFLCLLLNLANRSIAQSANPPDTLLSAAAGNKPDSLADPDPDPEGPRASAIGSLSAIRTAIIRLEIPKSSVTTLASLFRHFEVIDERADTARVGVHAYRLSIGGTRNRQLVFPGPVPREIADFLNVRFARSGAPYNALVVIRTLWLADANNMSEDMVQKPVKYDERRKIGLKADSRPSASSA